MEILGRKFAPLNVSMKRRLETLSVAIWFPFYGFGILWGYILAAYLIFCTETIRYFMIPYFLWMYYDWNTCDRGGRSEWCTRWARNSVFSRYMCNYFPVKLVKTTELNPFRNYLFCCCPHGIVGTGVSYAFATDSLDCKKLFPGLDFRGIVLHKTFNVPFFRECIYLIGCASSSPESIKYLLSEKPEKPFTGRVTALVVGGTAEILESKPGTYRIELKRRKGFIKIALKLGTPVVPVFSFGETDLYDQVYCAKGSIFRRVQDFVRQTIGIPLPILMGRGFFQNSFGIIPRRKPITVVVGSPLELPKIPEPTTEQIDEYHGKFVNQLIELFESHKHKYVKNADSVTLEFDW